MTVTIHNIPPTELVNVQVVAIKSIDPVTGAPNYDVSFSPAEIRVHSSDAIVNYQLIWPSTEGIRFTGMSVTPVDQQQFSDECVALNGLSMSFIDANTQPMILNVSINFVDADGNPFVVDPEIRNEPEGPE
jgi:hypothetical protein